MKFITTPIPGLLVVKPKIFKDARGHFFESFNSSAFIAAGLPSIFLQDNQSKSARDVVRGLHFQRPPSAQGKLVRVVKGAVLDVAVDIRQHSPYFGKHYAIQLDEENQLMLWIPEGFAHGFLSLEDGSILAYKCTACYDASAESSIRWNDPELNIQWGISKPLLSTKDSEAPFLHDIETPFAYEASY